MVHDLLTSSSFSLNSSLCFCLCSTLSSVVPSVECNLICISDSSPATSGNEHNSAYVSSHQSISVLSSESHSNTSELDVQLVFVAEVCSRCVLASYFALCIIIVLEKSNEVVCNNSGSKFGAAPTLGIDDDSKYRSIVLLAEVAPTLDINDDSKFRSIVLLAEVILTAGASAEHVAPNAGRGFSSERIFTVIVCSIFASSFAHVDCTFVCSIVDLTNVMCPGATDRPMSLVFICIANCARADLFCMRSRS